jgi:hypothetical protein
MTAVHAHATKALEVERIAYASFFIDQLGNVAGVATDKTSGTEFDVRRDGRVWNVNDDEGRNYRAVSLKRALRRACNAQKEPA